MLTTWPGTQKSSGRVKIIFGFSKTVGPKLAIFFDRLQIEQVSTISQVAKERNCFAVFERSEASVIYLHDL